MSKLSGNAIVGQSGGPTAVINATLVGVIRSAFKFNNIDTLYGMRNGIEGFLEERFVDLYADFIENGALNEEKLSTLEHTPASALGSCRKKLPTPEEDEALYSNILDIFKKYNIRYFFYIGGNDSMDTAYKIGEYVKNHDFEIRVIGLPKTIDNDIAETDHCPGFGSAAKYVANTVENIVMDCAIYDVPAVTIVEVMGRNSGWLASAAGLANPGPDYIYFSERFFSVDSFLNDVEKALLKHPNVVVVVAEGISYNNGEYVSNDISSFAFDEFGHKYFSGAAKSLEKYVKDKFNCKTRSIELNTCQRSCAQLVSAVDLKEARKVGEAGVEAAMFGASGCMVSIVRSNKAKSYSVTYETTDLALVANKIRILPDSFINIQGNGVTQKCINYLQPLVEGIGEVKYKNGVAVYYHI